MKKLFYTIITFLCAATAAIAVPPSPLYLQELAKQGDTAKISQMRHRHQAMEERRIAASPIRRAAQNANSAITLNLAPRGIVILVNFTDTVFRTSRAEMDSMLIGQNYTRNYSYRYGGTKYSIKSNGSFVQYFRDNSRGQYVPQLDIYGPYTVSHNMAYYGSNDGADEGDVHMDELVTEAVRLADQNGADFSQYDADRDRFVDFVLIYYAGYGEADGGGDDCLWPHCFWLNSGYGKTVTVDGKTIDAYGCFNERSAQSKTLNGIGTSVHEFSHVIGFPDLYATNNATHKTMGEWDVLDAGPYNNDGNTPPAYSAYERFVCGWLRPELLDETPRTISFGDLQSSNKAYVVTNSGEFNFIGTNPNPKEFYLIENRQKEGWDKYLPGHGMLITKVKYNDRTWWSGEVNNNKNSMGVDLIEADGSAPSYPRNGTNNGYYGKPGDAYPTGSTYETLFEFYQISNIVEEGSWVRFDMMGGAPNALEELDATLDLSQMTIVYDVFGRVVATKADGTISRQGLQPGMYIGRTDGGTTTKFYIR